MNLPAIFDSQWFDLGLGVAMIVLGALLAFKRRGGIGWASAIVFILWGLVLLYHGIFRIPSH
jgi:hypothetical protein